ncbi:MAG: nucleotidyltransferase domain-containing protein, partial [Syntrophales bacterium]
GIIKRIEKGRRIYYQANTQSAVFAELKSIIMKTVGVGDILKSALFPLANRVRAAFIYGSLARGDESKGSDVDVFVIGDVTFAEIVGVFSPIQQTLNREINPTVYPGDEFRAKLDAGNHFIKSVMEGSKLFLIGDEHDLAKLAS